jgi:hypothetical protein
VEHTEHNRGLMSFRKGEMTLEFNDAVRHVAMETVGRWLFQFTKNAYLTIGPVAFMTALQHAERHARDEGYIFIRVLGLAGAPDGNS